MNNIKYISYSFACDFWSIKDVAMLKIQKGMFRWFSRVERMDVNRLTAQML